MSLNVIRRCCDSNYPLAFGSSLPDLSRPRMSVHVDHLRVGGERDFGPGQVGGGECPRSSSSTPGCGYLFPFWFGLWLFTHLSPGHRSVPESKLTFVRKQQDAAAINDGENNDDTRDDNHEDDNDDEHDDEYGD